MYFEDMFCACIYHRIKHNNRKSLNIDKPSSINWSHDISNHKTKTLDIPVSALQKLLKDHGYVMGNGTGSLTKVQHDIKEF